MPLDGHDGEDYDESDSDCDSDGGTIEELRKRFYTRNPKGKNQHKSSDYTLEEFTDAVRPYLLYTTYSEARIRLFLEHDHGIGVGRSTYYNLIKQNNLAPAPLTRAEEFEHVKNFLLDDPLRVFAPRGVYQRLRHRGIRITRNRVTECMKALDPSNEGFHSRQPGVRKPHGEPGNMVTIGPNEQWSADGHDQLLAMGFPIYGIRDMASAFYLILLAVRSNHSPLLPGYLFLLAVRAAGGIPLQYATDRGSETRDGYAYQTALRQFFGPGIDPEAIPAYRFLQSIVNLTIERGWRPLKYKEVLILRHFWAIGTARGIYNPNNELHKTIAQWLWKPLVDEKLEEYKEWNNHHRVRKQRISRPSGVSPYEAWRFPGEHGLKDQLIPVDLDAVDALLAEYDAEILEFFPREVRHKCELLYRAVGEPPVTLRSVWEVFADMLHVDMAAGRVM